MRRSLGHAETGLSVSDRRRIVDELALMNAFIQSIVFCRRQLNGSQPTVHQQRWRKII